MEQLNIGIEACGKSFTVLAVADASGKILAAEKFSKRLNYNESTETGLGAEIYYLVKHILQTCNITVAEFSKGGGRIAIGITGLTNKYDRSIGFSRVWEAAGLAQEAKVSTGGLEIEFTGATRSLFGAAVSCHAGSAALARTKDVIRRVGGWGYLIGDEGSAYWIGSEMINALCRMRDGRLQSLSESRLPQYIQEELEKFPIWVEIYKRYEKLPNFNWIDGFVQLERQTRDSKQYRYIVSDLSKAVFRMFDEVPEDKVTRDIIISAADELVDQTVTVVKRAQLPTGVFPLVLWGGTFRFNNSFCNFVKAKLAGIFPEANIIVPTDQEAMRPVIGALLFALSGSMFTLPPSDVIKRVEQSASQFPVLTNN